MEQKRALFKTKGQELVRILFGEHCGQLVILQLDLYFETSQLYFETRILKLRGCILRNPEELRDRTLPVSGGEWGRKNISHHVVPCTSMVCRIRMESSGCVAVSFSDLIFVRPQTKITKLTSLRTAPHILYNYLIWIVKQCQAMSSIHSRVQTKLLPETSKNWINCQQGYM